MNITSINSNYQPINKQPQFRGAIGNRLLEKSAGRLETNVVMKEMSGTFGINKDKLKDILEAFVEKLNLQENLNKLLKSDNISKDKSIDELTRKNNEANRRIEILEAQVAGKEQENKNLKEIILERDSEIKELEPYRSSLKVKSVDELDIVHPQQVIETLEIAAKNQKDALASAFEFATTGKGEEALLKQLEYSNILLRAIKDQVHLIPEVADALNKFDEKNIKIGYDPESVARLFFKIALQANPKGNRLIAKPYYVQTRDNIEAFLAPLRTQGYSYCASNEVVDSAKKFHEDLAHNKDYLINNRGFNFKEFIESEDNHCHTAYYIFTRPNGGSFKISATNLSLGLLGRGEMYDPNGTKINS